MQLRHIFSELAQGLRRNLSMHLAVILTLFVSLTLVGLGVLLSQQATKTSDYWGSQLQITVWLCKAQDNNPACTSEVTPAQEAAIIATISESPEVADHYTESQAVALQKAKELLGAEKFEGNNPAATEKDFRSSVWIELKDAREFEAVVSAVKGLDGVSSVSDMRDTLRPIYKTISIFKYGAAGTAAFLVVAALLLVANTIRLAAFARRREIGIMRLVGASSLYIALPFLMEALVTALIGVAMAGGALGAFMYWGVHGELASSVGYMPWVGAPEFWWALLAIGTLGPLLTIVPTLVLTRKYLKV